MQLRVDRTTGGPSGYQILWVIGFVWTFGSFLRYTLPLAGMDATPRACGSPTRSHGAAQYWARWRLDDSCRRASARRGAPRACSCLHRRSLVAESRIARLGRRDAPRSNSTRAGIQQTSFYVALVVTVSRCWSIAPSPYAMQRTSSKPRWFGRGVILLVLVQITATLFTMRARVARFSTAGPGPDQRTLGHSLVDTGRRFAGADSLRGPGAQAQSLAAGERGCIATWSACSFSRYQDWAWWCRHSVRGTDAERAASHARAEFSGRSDSPGSAGLRGRGQRLRGIGERIYEQEQLFELALQTVRTTLRLDASWVRVSADARAARAGIGLDRTGRPPRLIASKSRPVTRRAR